MLVYRICKKSELERIFEDNNFTNVGYNFPVSDLNTHNYTENSKYLHFFLKKESIFYLRTLKDRYICIYDIPEDILNRYKVLLINGKTAYISCSEFDRGYLPGDVIPRENNNQVKRRVRIIR